MIKKNKESLTHNKKSIYYDLKEFHDRNQGVLYTYQDLELAGIREFKSITGKIQSLKSYEKNRLANELIRILLQDIHDNNGLTNLNEYITLNPIINYYENFIKIFKDSLEINENLRTKMKDIIRKMIIESGSSEEIKLGLILSPICNIENIEAIVDVLSIHNDYLFYVIKVYEYIGNCNNTIFEMAKKSKGYGKIFCVMNLRPTTYEIRKWMIEEGSVNNVGVPELLSYSMLSLELLDYLQTTEFDEKELEILAKSFSMLLSDYGLDEINDGIKVFNKLLEIIDKVDGGIYCLYVVISILYSIESIVIDDYKTKGNPSSFKFNNDYKNIVEVCKRICKKDTWHEIISNEISN